MAHGWWAPLCFRSSERGYSSSTRVSCVLAVYALPSICVVGIGLNVLSAATFLTYYRRSRRLRVPATALFLTVLSVYDSLQLLLSIFLICFGAILEFLGDDSEGWWVRRVLRLSHIYAIRYFYPLLMAVNYASVWTITLIAVQRFFAVCWPLKSRALGLLRRKRASLCLIAAVAALVNVPRFWEHRIIHRWDHHANASVPHLVPGPLNPKVNGAYLIGVDGVFYTLFVYGLPALGLGVLNARILQEIQHSQTLALVGALSQRERREQRSSYMLISIVVLFVLCQSLAVGLRWVEILAGKAFGRLDFSWLLYDLSNVLVNLNSTANPLLYFVFTSRFRDILLGARKKNGPDVGTTGDGSPTRSEQRVSATVSLRPTCRSLDHTKSLSLTRRPLLPTQRSEPRGMAAHRQASVDRTNI